MSHLQATIVEDEPDLSTIFSAALEQSGFETQVVDNGARALEHLQTHTPHLILLDLNLPEVNGDVILEHIRSEPRLNRTLVVLTTSDAAGADLLQDQADFVMLKPISFIQLMELSKRWKTMLEQRSG